VEESIDKAITTYFETSPDAQEASEVDVQESQVW
jgi:hypothetical protein